MSTRNPNTAGWSSVTIRFRGAASSTFVVAARLCPGLQTDPKWLDGRTHATAGRTSGGLHAGGTLDTHSTRRGQRAPLT